MKKLYLLALFLFSCKLVFGQEVEAINLGERDQSITALNRNYYGAAVHIQRMDHGSVWSVTPEYLSGATNGRRQTVSGPAPGSSSATMQTTSRSVSVSISKYNL